jgi:hypothetical protein
MPVFAGVVKVIDVRCQEALSVNVLAPKPSPLYAPPAWAALPEYTTDVPGVPLYETEQVYVMPGPLDDETLLIIPWGLVVEFVVVVTEAEPYAAEVVSSVIGDE